jgi:hypothetical protein
MSGMVISFCKKSGKRVEVFFTICSKSLLNINKLKRNCGHGVAVFLVRAVLARSTPPPPS